MHLGLQQAKETLKKLPDLIYITLQGQTYSLDCQKRQFWINYGLRTPRENISDFCIVASSNTRY